jgi:hypothetical protein
MLFRNGSLLNATSGAKACTKCEAFLLKQKALQGEGVSAGYGGNSRRSTRDFKKYC